jgi:hypothetical protein
VILNTLLYYTQTLKKRQLFRQIFYHIENKRKKRNKRKEIKEKHNKTEEKYHARAFISPTVINPKKSKPTFSEANGPHLWDWRASYFQLPFLFPT